MIKRKRGRKKMGLFEKKKEEEPIEEIQATPPVKLTIGAKTTAKGDTPLEYFNKNYAGATDRQQMVNAPLIEKEATMQDLLFAIYCELWKLNQK